MDGRGDHALGDLRRGAALRLLSASLGETAVLGVGTNVAFLRALLADPDVQAGNLDTGLVGRRAAELARTDLPDDVVGLVDSTRARIGLSTYASSFRACPDVRFVPPAFRNAAAIRAEMNSVGPGVGTPTVEALRAGPAGGGPEGIARRNVTFSPRHGTRIVATPR